MGWDTDVIFNLVLRLQGCSDKKKKKINATYVQGRVCHVRLIQVTKFCGIINQLTCSMKGRGGIYFGTCKCKKGQGVKKKHLPLDTFWRGKKYSIASTKALPTAHR